MFRLIFSLTFLLLTACSTMDMSEQERPSRMVTLDQNSPQTTALLKRYMPRVFVDPASYHPLDFYKDYLPYTTAHLKDRKIKQLDAASLATYAKEGESYLDFQMSYKDYLGKEVSAEPVPIYGRIYEDELEVDGTSKRLLFLKYNLVFPYSGLPAGLSGSKEFFSAVIGPSNAWHELDIHGAVQIVLDAERLEPVGVLLAQHNYQRSYILAELEWPADDHLSITYATRSNEPYLSLGETRYERTVGNPLDLPYLLGLTDKQPLSAGMDKIIGLGESVEIPVTLTQLSLTDPLYTSELLLGNKDRIWGIFTTWYRMGPPGMDFYAPPSLENLADLFAFFYKNSTSPTIKKFYAEAKNWKSFSFENMDPVILAQKKLLLKDLQASN